jgi:uncharacterized delta-60 repeat protein
MGMAVALIALVFPAAAPGRAKPDRDFGGKGFVKTKIGGSTALAYGATVLGGGKVVIVGQKTGSSGAGQIVVARYRSDGRLDRRFASGGIFRTTLPKKNGPFIARAVARERSSRRLIVAGGYGQGSILALRLTADGRLSRSFGNGRSGLAKVNVGGIAQSVAIQRDKRILLGASDANTNGRPMVIARLNRNGTLDRSFGTGGTASSMLWDANLAASAGITGLAVAADGTITGSGHLDYIGSDGHGSAGVFQLDSSGMPPAGFGTGGHVEVAFNEPGGTFAQWFPCAMGVDALGRITVTGNGSVGSTAGLLTTRLLPTGTPDPAYGRSGDGRVVTPGPGDGNDTTCGATLAPDAALTAGVGSSLAQLTPDGAANPGFARNGVLNINRPKKLTLNAVARSGARRIVVAGGAGRKLYVGRYLVPRP